MSDRDRRCQQLANDDRILNKNIIYNARIQRIMRHLANRVSKQARIPLGQILGNASHWALFRVERSNGALQKDRESNNVAD
jgi:hypothetical protein